MTAKASVLILLATMACSQSATMLIDGSTLNGGFETNTGTTHAEMSAWFNNPGPQSTAVRSGNAGQLANFGSYGAIVSLASNPTVNTGHSITVGDVFTAEFYLRDNTAGGNPVISWDLFYFGNENEIGFDEETSTDRVVVFSGSATATSTTYQAFDFTTAAVDPDSTAIGSTLYLRFYRTTGDGQFPVIDNVTLAVPETSTTLLGVLGAVLLFRRRR